MDKKDYIDRAELLRILGNGSKYNPDVPMWVMNVICRMDGINAVPITIDEERNRMIIDISAYNHIHGYGIELYHGKR